MNGANHTDKTCQLHIESTISLWANNQPSPNTAYGIYRRNRRITLGDDEVRINGTPRTAVSVPAREKFRTVIMDITVDVRHRLAALRIANVGAASSFVCGGRTRNRRGTAVNVAKTTDEKILKN